MSHVEGTDDVVKALETFGKSMSGLTYELFDSEMVKTQADAVSLIPVHTGKAKAALSTPEALQRDSNKSTGVSIWTFGMTTLAIQKAAYYLFWVEFGTKGHARGELVSPGTADNRSRSGRKRRARRRKRGSPARPAHPWFRPVRDHLFARLQGLQGFEQMVKVAKRAAGFADSR